MVQLERAPVARAEMLIRKPVADVFLAFVDPAVTTQFWFTRSSGRLAAGQRVRWDWDMYDVSMEVTVRSVEANERILVEWPAEDGGHTTVEWTFTPQSSGATFVSITNSGFTGDGDQVTRQAVESTEGFTLVLAGLKALLEHGIRLNLVADRFPRGLGGP